MLNNSASPIELFASFWRNKGLISALTVREIRGRYEGTTFGLLWSFLNPVLMLAVYTFVFSVIFKARWSQASTSKTEFALILFSGLIIFNCFAECLTRAPGLILSNPNYVKKVVFPLEVLPWVVVGSALFHATVSLLVWFVAYLIFFGVPQSGALLVPVLFVPLVFLCLGSSWFFASLGVYIRDVSQFVGILTTVLLFLSPIFYPAESLPEAYRGLLALNPLTSLVEMMRNSIFWGRSIGLSQLAACLLSSLVVACAGFAWFQKTRRGFADVI